MAEGSGTANRPLQGHKITLLGTFANRSRLIDLIQSRGGQLISSLSDQTTLLIIGQERWPITKQGRLNSNVIEARRFQAQGTLIILTENDLLDRLGQEREPMGSCDLSTGQLSHLLKVSETRLRRWVQAGLLQPRGLSPGAYLFNFQQVQWAKNLRDFCKAGVSTLRIRRSLERLKHWLPGFGQTQSDETVLEQDGQLLVRLEDGRLADSKGQRVFDFAEDAGEVMTLDIKPKESGANGRLERGQELEEAGDLKKAAEVYQQVMLAAGPDATTCFNLANVLYKMSQRKQAVERYWQAVELKPDFVEAWNNLGLALSDLSQRDRACKAYEKALLLDPTYANARFNLADLLTESGRSKEARVHWQMYAQQDSQSTWGRYALNKSRAQLRLSRARSKPVTHLGAVLL